MRVVGQVHVKNKIVCAWCAGSARPLRTRPDVQRAYYECEANCNPNDGRTGTRTVFAVAWRAGQEPKR